jgi:hypothetical protein
MFFLNSEYQLLNTTRISRTQYACKQGVKIGFNTDGSLHTLYDPFNKVSDLKISSFMFILLSVSVPQLSLDIMM